MSEWIDWRVGEDVAEEMPAEDGTPPRRPFLSALLFLLATAVLLGGVFSFWTVGQRQLEQSEAALRQQVQDVLNLQHRAVLRGDGGLFFAYIDDDPAFRAAQLLPQNVAAYRAGLTATRARLHDGVITANLRWTTNGETVQRIAFYEPDGAALRQIPTAPDYWGSRQVWRTGWGELKAWEIDAEWAEETLRFVQAEIIRLCRRECRERPLTVVVRDDFQPTVVPDTIHVPSPRLLGLDESGAPSRLFWEALRREVAAQLTLATIRFGLPAADFPLVDFARAAQAFMDAHPHVTVELVQLETAVPTMADLQGLDGAAITPDQEMLAAGFVRDLTPYVTGDAEFAPRDYYEQIWRGAWWQERIWFIPQAGQMRLLYYDREAYQQAERPFPSLRWTWEEMAEDISAVANPQLGLPHGLLDVGNDTLFSYAYNWQNACPDQATVRCLEPLSPQAVAAALDWYRQMAQNGQIVDLTQQPFVLPESPQAADVRNAILSNWQSARRQSTIWVDDPLYYELRLLLAPLGVVPFPGSDRFDGITPLWVQGNVILQQSERPLAVWQWLKFLSYQPPSPRYRMIPARPSVANQSGYWSTLPRALGEPMRAAFPFARPVLIEEQAYFGWEVLTAVLSGDLTPEQAARRVPPPRWFTSP